MKMSLESTQRSCQILDSCEKLGTNTAQVGPVFAAYSSPFSLISMLVQELLVQREKLRTSTRTWAKSIAPRKPRSAT